MSCERRPQVVKQCQHILGMLIKNVGDAPFCSLDFLAGLSLVRVLQEKQKLLNFLVLNVALLFLHHYKSIVYFIPGAHLESIHISRTSILASILLISFLVIKREYRK